MARKLGEDAIQVRSFQKGDRHSFDTLVLKYQDHIFNLCYRFLGDYAEANDAAQDVFLKVFRSLSGFRFESKFSTWLYRVAVNTCKNRLSSRTFKNRKKTESIENAEKYNPHRRNTPVSEGMDTPANALERKE